MLQLKQIDGNYLEVPYLKAVHVQWNGIKLEKLPKMWANKREIQQFQINQGDLLVCEGGEVGRAVILDANLPEKCIIQNSLHRVRGSHLGEVRFLKYWLKYFADQGWLDVLCNKATIAHFTVDKFRKLKIYAPSKKKQQQIADYLDRETEEIDTLISEKKQMISLLEEKRRALINTIVTKGLKRRKKLKPSGLKCLGDIPRNWKVVRIKFLVTSIIQGSSPIANNVPAKPHEFGILKLSAIAKGKFIREENKALLRTGDYVASNALKKDDILITRGNTPQLVADVCIVPEDEPNLLISDLIYKIQVDKSKIIPDFLSLFLLTTQARRQIGSDARGSSYSMLKVSQDHIKNWSVVLPPMSEQKKIVDYIQKSSQKIERLTTYLLESIELLKEKRSALITSVITGQTKPEKTKIPKIKQLEIKLF